MLVTRSLRKKVAKQNQEKFVPENLLSWSKVIFVASIAAGTVNLFFYCAQIGVSPRDLSLSDSLVLLFSAFGFAVGYGTWMLVSFAIVMGMILCIKPPAPHPNLLVRVFLALPVILMIVLGGLYTSVYLEAQPSREMRALAAWISTLLSGTGSSFLFLAVNSRSRRRNSTLPQPGVRVAVQFFFLALIASLLVAIPFVSEVTQWSFSFQGIRMDDGIVLLDDSNTMTVRAAASLSGIPAAFCKTEAWEPAALRNAHVLWHGLGDRSIISLQSPDKTRTVRIELKPNGMQLLVANPAIGSARCVT